MDSDVKLDSSQFRRELSRRLNRLENGAEEEVYELGDTARSLAQNRVAVDTGLTKGTISVSKGRDFKGPYVEVKAGGASAVLEFGTRRMRARPFFRRALVAASKTLRAPRI